MLTVENLLFRSPHIFLPGALFTVILIAVLAGTKPYSPFRIIISVNITVTPTDGFGADYDYALIAVKLVNVFPTAKPEQGTTAAHRAIESKAHTFVFECDES